MTTHKTNRKVDIILSKAERWQKELAKLRTIVLDCDLTEELKWYQPCYTHQGKNVVIIHGFKQYFALLFFKGALMKDPKGILIRQTENVQSGRQIRFTSLQEITRMTPVLKAYIREAIEVEKSGKKVKMNTTLKMPEELQNKLDKDAAFKKAFFDLTPGRQRAYGIYFSAAKQAETRVARIEKCLPLIFKGKGLTDEYNQKRKKK